MREYKQMKEIKKLREQEAAEGDSSEDTRDEQEKYEKRRPGFQGWMEYIGEYYKWPILIVGVIYIIARSAGKIFGANASARLTKCEPTICKYLGITLLPQAGVALGMCITARQLGPEGDLIRNIILFSVLIYELVGPALTKRSLLKAGEINPEGKTSARMINTPKPPVDIHN